MWTKHKFSKHVFGSAIKPLKFSQSKLKEGKFLTTSSTINYWHLISTKVELLQNYKPLLEHIINTFQMKILFFYVIGQFKKIC